MTWKYEKSLERYEILTCMKRLYISRERKDRMRFKSRCAGVPIAMDLIEFTEMNLPSGALSTSIREKDI